MLRNRAISLLRGISGTVPALATLMLSGCIEDGVETSPSAQPVFSSGTVSIGTVFTGETSRTSRLMVYNRHSKSLLISRISLRSGSGVFRLNVDGASGTEFRDVEIRSNDSIYVLLNVTPPENRHPGIAELVDYIDFENNGVTTSVTVSADCQDVVRLRGETVTADAVWDTAYPYQVFDSLVVSKGATLTLPAGATLLFHDKAYMRVKGNLVTEGTPQQPVTLTGDRLGNVVGDISFSLMASQWDGIRFDSSSRGNRLSHTTVSNTDNGVTADMYAAVKFVNCRLRNSAGHALKSEGAQLELTGCEVADAGSTPLLANGGSLTATHCTFANYYLFAAPVAPAAYINIGPVVQKFAFFNCIFFGAGRDIELRNSDGNTDLQFRNCLMKSSGTDDSIFINTLWDSDPMFATVREEYIFDYRLLPGSPAIGAADPQYSSGEAHADMYGTERGAKPSIGAYQSPIDN